MTPEDFDAHFDRFHHTVIRLETLPAYDVGGSEAERIQAWRNHQPRPERSVRTSPWLARIAVTATQNKQWRRVRVLDDPPTEYQRYQLDSYVESQAAGEQILIASRRDVGDVGPDFWLFDTDRPGVFAIVMRYDDEGHWTGADLTTDPSALDEMHARVQRVAGHARPLNVYLAGQAAVSA